MTSYEHKLKNAYLGGKWIPSGDTMLYLKFNDNLDDSSGNSRTVTNSGTVAYNQNPSAVNLTTSSYLYSDDFDALTHDRTVNIWVKLTTLSNIDNANAQHVFSIGSSSTNNCIFLGICTNANGGNRTGALQFSRYANDKFTASGLVTTNQRYNIVYTYNYTTRKAKAYVNGTKALDETFNSQYTLGTRQLCIGANATSKSTTGSRVQGSLSEYIVESREWAEGDVADYFDQTKSLYGIS